MSFKIKGEKREVFGKNASRRLRRNGMIPVILYGAKDMNIPLTLNKKDVFQILRSEAGENTVFEVSFNSETINAMIKDLQKNCSGQGHSSIYSSGHGRGCGRRQNGRRIC